MEWRENYNNKISNYFASYSSSINGCQSHASKIRVTINDREYGKQSLDVFIRLIEIAITNRGINNTRPRFDCLHPETILRSRYPILAISSSGFDAVLDGLKKKRGQTFEQFS